MAKLTDKQRLFIDEYLVDLNATQAAIRAGYSPRSAGELGSRLRDNPPVRDAIDKAMAERSKRTGISADRVLRELARVALLNPKDVINFATAEVKPDATDDDLAAIAGMKVKYVPHKDFDDDGEPIIETAIERETKFHDKVKALELAGKHLNMFKEDPDSSAPVTVVINYDYKTD